ncbi:amidohydrolase family protein [Embleya hyalina]|uniref:Amidohydrolase-related domain-containing protein n=1 Tax=Embleya hyalina TaxID=516124 RepID=A0A401YJY4_9ACTN|nr:amidohydrolase family protein [Embleya hyalina]GCD94932.1 hypothetical protein EHYA_02601 [Embleya hyalina]
MIPHFPHETVVPAHLKDLPLARYTPRSRLVVGAHEVERASLPVVDAHIHLGRWLSEDGGWVVPDVGALLAMMDELNIRGMVNLDGRWGTELDENLARYDHAHPGRFATFCHVDWRELATPGFEERIAAGIRRAAETGAVGLKVWKDLGLQLRDHADTLVMVDDPRLDTLWATAGEVGLPIWIHTADPVAFFDPIDEHNERLELLLARPDWSFADERFPSFERLVQALENAVARHPGTTFVGVHMGCYPENLQWVGRMLDTYPNFHVDIAARIAELGRQPRATTELILRHPDRVLFGTDEIPPDRASYRRHFRFLETADEGFPHSDQDPPLMGRWAISGLDLPRDVLAKVYTDNALRLVPRLAS